MTEEAAPSSPETFGRVDAEGRVFVRTHDGEREVGSYPGASDAEALAYFARKYDELVAQVDLFAQRLTSTDLPPSEAKASLTRLREAIANASAVGDLDGLAARLEALAPVVQRRRAEADAARARARQEAVARKEHIVTEAEELAGSSQWKSTGERLRTLLEEWKAAPRLDKSTDDALWARFRAARSSFDKRRRAHFAALDASREQASEVKERIAAEAESLANSTDWGPTAARLRALMAEWKAAGRAGREQENALWERFRAAQDAFFAARNAIFTERETGYQGNLEAKQALLAEAERLLPVSDPRSARAALRSLQERWEKAGRVPREEVERIEGRMRRVEEAVRAAEESHWRRSNPEARARAEGAVAQLQASISTLERKLATAQSAGDERATREASEALAARRAWLAEAEKTLAEFSGPRR